MMGGLKRLPILAILIYAALQVPLAQAGDIDSDGVKDIVCQVLCTKPGI